jgi:hypothetical protein
VKRLVGAIAAGVGVFSMVFGLAASLSVTSDSLGAGTSVVAACQAGAFNVQYNGPTYASSIPGYSSATATISGITASCESLPYRITLYGAGGTSLGEATGTTPGTTGNFTTGAFSGTPSDHDVTGVALVISTH